MRPILLFLVCILMALASVPVRAQRAFEQGDQIVYEDGQGRKIPLGRGHSSILLSGTEILLIRGARFGYGDQRSCRQPDSRNRIVVHNVAAAKDTVIYDSPLGNEFIGPDDACVYKQADLSPSRSILYVVTPWSATSGLLAIIDLPTETSKYVFGVHDVYVIRGGQANGDLIYSRRLLHKTPDDSVGHPYSPFIHARPDGTQVAIISDEYFTVGGNDVPPGLGGYLKRVHGQIYAYGKWLPPLR